MTTALTTATPAGHRVPRVRGPVRVVLDVHRTALVVWAVALLGGTSLLFRLAALAAEAERGNSACATPPTDGLPSCASVEAITADQTYATGIALVTACLAWLILPVAAWAAAALTGRELEHGTAHLAWTQSVAPTRWLTAKLALPAALLTTGTTALVLLGVWARGKDNPNLVGDWYHPEVFIATGPTAVAHALTGLALGALAGTVLGRALPAAGTALAATLLLRELLERYRPHLWPTVTRDTAGWEVPRSALQVSSDETLVTLHPRSHFWPIQYVESGILLALTAAAVAGTFLLLRRRTA
ncbi:hypothetical protein [Streptomyces sp. NPDC000983]|uniref:hypothetical protein n=1 Tax=Streptomyces sp. NPDC000983 TaxID=3154373 RepID=UPI0033280F8F